MANQTGTQGTSAFKMGEKYTLDDYRSWPDNERWELINGKAYAMSPSPRIWHQRLVGKLYLSLSVYVSDANSRSGRSCEPFIAPIDVFLTGPDEAEDTVVQPDILVVCDPDKIHEDGIHGAPDLVVEILSPSTAARDLEDKKALYERHGVGEYWIVKTDGSVFVWTRNGPRFLPGTEYLTDMVVPSKVITGFEWKPRT